MSFHNYEKKVNAKQKKRHLDDQKNIKCNKINRSKIDPKYFEKIRTKVFSMKKKSFETISFHIKEIFSNKRKENVTFSWQHQPKIKHERDRDISLGCIKRTVKQLRLRTYVFVSCKENVTNWDTHT